MGEKIPEESAQAYDAGYLIGYRQAQRDLSELIERDKAKKPIKKEYEDDDLGYPETFYLCHECGYPLGMDETGCPNCLQRIDWSE